jgi:hypothetical protein
LIINKCNALVHGTIAIQPLLSGQPKPKDPDHTIPPPQTSYTEK